jgi:type VI secretion system protein ImpA
MAKPPLLEVEQLLGEVPGEFANGLKGAGDPNLFDTLRDEFNELREEVPPGAKDVNGQPRDPKKADWKKLEELAKETLQKKSKDLRVAGCLTEALVRQHGFAGMRDGLGLIRRLCEACWDRLYPVIEDGDPLSRFEPVLNMIDDPDRGLMLPSTLRKLPLVRPKEKDKPSYSVFDYELAQDPKRPEAKTLETINQTMTVTPYEQIRGDLEEITASLAERDKLFQMLGPKMNNKGPAPGFVKIREALTGCQRLAEIVAKKVAPLGPPPGSEADNKEGPGAKGDGAAPGKRAVPTRADIYSQLQALADQLGAMEPHSPIPYLIRRCVTLGNLPFPDMIKELVREDKILAEMKRELGIKDATPAKK